MTKRYVSLKSAKLNKENIIEKHEWKKFEEDKTQKIAFHNTFMKDEEIYTIKSKKENFELLFLNYKIGYKLNTLDYSNYEVSSLLRTEELIQNLFPKHFWTIISNLREKFKGEKPVDLECCYLSCAHFNMEVSIKSINNECFWYLINGKCQNDTWNEKIYSNNFHIYDYIRDFILRNKNCPYFIKAKDNKIKKGKCYHAGEKK